MKYYFAVFVYSCILTHVRFCISSRYRDKRLHRGPTKAFLSFTFMSYRMRLEKKKASNSEPFVLKSYILFDGSKAQEILFVSLHSV